MAKTYSLNDLGVTADDLILLDEAGYGFDETDNISEEKRDEILSRLYDLKHKDKANAPKEAPAADYAAGVEAATPEQAKQMKYELKNGQQLDLQDVASLVKSEQIVSKDVRAEMKRVIVEAANADTLAKEDVAALGYLLDEINGKHAAERGNAHSVHEYRKQFDDNPEVLEAAARKLETRNVYNREELEALLRQGEIYLAKPEEIQENPDAGRRDNHQQLFADHVHEVETLIKDYAEGRVSIEPDAMESMEKLLDAYGKDYVRGTGSKDKFKNGVSYDITQEACDAQQRLAAERKAYREAFGEADRHLDFVKQYPDMVENLVKDIAYAGTDAEKEAAVAKFNKEMSKAMDEAGANSDAYKERNRTFLEDQLKDDQNLFGYLGNEYNDAAQYLLDKDGKLKDGVAVYVEPENRTEKVEEKTPVVEEKTEEKAEEKKGPSKEELDAAKKKKPKDRTLHDWIVLKEGIENNPKLSDGQKKYELKSLTDQARSHKMTNPKSVSDEELKDADQFMKAFGYDIDKKGRAATNPIAMRWQDAIKKRQAALANSEEKEVSEPVKPVEKTDEEQKKDDKSDDKGDDKGHGGVIPVVPPRHITNDKGVTEWEGNKPAEDKKKEETKKKKGLFGRIGDWAKRNWKKIAIGGAILAASLFGAKQCQSQQQDDKGKDKIEVVTPTPEREQQLPEVVVTATQDYDLEMAKQYCKRMGYQTKDSEENIDARFFRDRMTYANIKDRVAGHMGIDSLTIDQQMAVLATVRGNTPDNAPVVDAILNGREPGGENGYNVATLAKLRKEASKFTVRAEDGTIQYTNPEEFTKQTGSQSVSVSKDNIKKKGTELGFTASHHSSYRGMD